MLLGPMIVSILSGLTAALAWVLTGGSLWVAITIVYGLAATLGLIASAPLMALRSPETSVSVTGPKHISRRPIRDAARRKRGIAVYGPGHRTAVPVRLDAKALCTSRDRRV